MAGIAKVTKLLSICCLELLMWGCATTGVGGTFHLQPVPEADVRAQAGANGPRMISKNPNSTVVIEPKSTMYSGGKRPGFEIYIQNTSDYDFPFGLANIRVLFNAVTLPIVRPEVLVAEAANAAEEAKRAAASAKSSAMLLAMSSALGGVLGSATNKLGQLNTATSQALDTMAQGMAQGDVKVKSAEADRARDEAAHTAQRYQTEMLREQLVHPGSQHGGYFYASAPDSIGDSGFLEVLVDLGAEYHDFRFEISRVAP